MLLRKLGITAASGATAKTKRLLARIYRETLEHRKIFLKGLLDADGWYGRTRDDVATLHLAQRNLLQDVMLLCRTLGIPSKLRGPYGPYGKKGNISFRLDVPRAVLRSVLRQNDRGFRLKYGSRVPRFVMQPFLEHYPKLLKKFFANNSDYVEYRRWKNGGTCLVSFFSDFLTRYNLYSPQPVYLLYRLKTKRVLNQSEITYTLSVSGSHRFDSEGIISKNTAADIMKKAMIEVDRYLGARNMRDEVRLLLQIHDELMFEIKKGRVESVVPEIRRIMESVWTGKVAMKVEVKKGVNWGTLE